MRAERVPIAARLDAIDLAIANVERIWEPESHTPPAVQERRSTQRVGKPRVSKPQAETTAATGLGSDDDRVLRAVKSLVSASREQVVESTGLDAERVTKAKHRLEAKGAIVVKGWARASRWSLPATKEAP